MKPSYTRHANTKTPWMMVYNYKGNGNGKRIGEGAVCRCCGVLGSATARPRSGPRSLQKFDLCTSPNWYWPYKKNMRLLSIPDSGFLIRKPHLWFAVDAAALATRSRSHFTPGTEGMNNA